MADPKEQTVEPEQHCEKCGEKHHHSFHDKLKQELEKVENAVGPAIGEAMFGGNR